ncbi:hypothetical protein EQP59_05240 [Ornithobacterium rhinotracheale]|uniref:Uncharacterized protein n=1 Tax=Ornithobacterium rhinotracheale TaxID=28251 RepID=A0A410JRN0_ORNRH|nr:hypothetical protein [Ornithobacterium rhinotracheale]QAR30784.1 hypothetical protein EQP59_05240 [Ornithobacterium rhinotracheale]
MEEEIIRLNKETIEKLVNYPTHPVYSIQVNKMKCRVAVLVNGLPHWLPLTENVGESMTLYLNRYIPKSGKQLITVQIYPNEGVEFFPYDAVADIRLQYAPDKFKTPIYEYQVMTEQSLPEDIGGKRLSYYEMKIPFEAVVPYDFSEELNQAQDLTQIPNIKQKILAKYNYLKKIMEDGDGIAFVKEQEHSSFYGANYLYATKEELLGALNMEDDNDIELFCSHEIEYRKIPEFTNYELVFGLDGKVVFLRSKKDKKTMFKVYVGGEYEDPFEYNFYLYMPEGSNELKIW